MKPQERKLKFHLPPRRAWVSEQARLRWEPELTRIGECWKEIEWMSIAHHVRPCALLWMSQAELAKLAVSIRKFGIRAMPVGSNISSNGRNRKLLYHVAIGQSADIKALRRALAAKADDLIGELLGYPACCRTSFIKAIGNTDALNDVLHYTILNSPKSEPNGLTEINCAPQLNMLWTHEHVRLVPHYPCRFDCSNSAAISEKFLATGNSAGHTEILKTAMEILQWPVEWSSLHGIAELKTPVLKLSYQTDYKDTKCFARYNGGLYPPEGARSSCFPYNRSTLAN